jgi:hypothetical protein
VEDNPYFLWPDLLFEGLEESIYDAIITVNHDVSFDTESLFCNFTVSDIIAFVYGGNYDLCDSNRNICPDCTGGRAQNFGAFMGCGVSLACPICMGLGFCLEHKEFLEEHSHDSTPDEEEREVDGWIQD